MSSKKKAAPVEEKPARKMPLGPLSAECCMDPKDEEGHMHLTIEGGTVSQGDKKIGSIHHIVGGGVAIWFEDGFSYHVGAHDLFVLVYAAHEAWKKENGR